MTYVIKNKVTGKFAKVTSGDWINWVSEPFELNQSQVNSIKNCVNEKRLIITLGGN